MLRTPRTPSVISTTTRPKSTVRSKTPTGRKLSGGSTTLRPPGASRPQHHYGSIGGGTKGWHSDPWNLTGLDITGGLSSRGHEAVAWLRDDASGVGGKQVSCFGTVSFLSSSCPFLSFLFLCYKIGLGHDGQNLDEKNHFNQDLPSSSGLIYCPSINPIPPLDTPSLNSPSPLLRQPSPFVLRWGGFITTSTVRFWGHETTTSLITTTDRVGSSLIGIDSRPSPPQPPFTPSTFCDRRSSASAEGASGSHSGRGGAKSPSPKM